MRRALVCLSGGVDSAVAALVLLENGWDVQAVTFSLCAPPHKVEEVPGNVLDAARSSARELAIPHQIIDASDAFKQCVLSDYVERYRRGETPNPCGRCNRFLRFDLALTQARHLGCTIAATGHHVRKVVMPDGAYALLRGADRAKDQTYFLYGLGQAALASLEFPVGEMTKDEVFAMARAAGLGAADQPESQDLCFALAGDASHLFSEADLQPGPIRTLSGEILGQHRGLPHYTVGQRRGLGIAAHEPLYVVDVDPHTNTVWVGPEDALLRSSLHAYEASYLSGRPPEDGMRIAAKIRYRSPAVPAILQQATEDRFSLTFESPQRAITPGQLAVLYDGERLLGGGTIMRSGSPSVP